MGTTSNIYSVDSPNLNRIGVRGTMTDHVPSSLSGNDADQTDQL